MVTKFFPVQSLALKEKMSKVQECSAAVMFADYNASLETIWSMRMETVFSTYSDKSHLPLGYNHPDLIAANGSEEAVQMLTQRPCLGMMPSDVWP